MGLIETVCFDLGDTLIEEESIIRDRGGNAVNARVIDGSFNVLAELRKKGYKLAVVCNGESINARNILKATGLERFFDFIAVSEEVGVEKPDKRIFLTALDILETKPENAVMVGNRVSADILGAKSLGMKAILFSWNNRYNDPVKGENEKPDHTITALKELPQLINKLETP